MKRIRQLISMWIVSGLLLMAMPLQAFAGSAISSVGIRVTLNLDPGSDLPDDGAINLTEDLKTGETGCSVTASSSKYYVDQAEWISTDGRDVQVGDTAKLRVYLTPNDRDEHYFRGSYTSSNITIKGGTYVSAKRDGEQLVVTIKTNPLKGDYDSPEDAYWRDSGFGKAKWDEPDNTSGYYDVYLHRGSSLIKKVEGFKGTTYNFYPYMTKEGNYSFKVRTVPRSGDSNEYGKKSDWSESDEVYIGKEHVSDGSGQASDGSEPGSTNGTVGWIKDGEIWYYRYPDGTYQKNSFLKVKEYWYLFDGAGKMLTGWQNRNNLTYLMRPSGEMLTGWYQADNKWYYFNQNPGDLEGALCKSAWIQQENNETFFVGASGVMAEGWTQVENNWYYFAPGRGNRISDTTIDSFYLDKDGIWRK